MMQTRAYVYVCVYHENVTTRSRTVTIEIAMGEYYSRWEMQNTMINGIDGFSRSSFPIASPERISLFFFFFSFQIPSFLFSRRVENKR